VRNRRGRSRIGYSTSRCDERGIHLPIAIELHDESGAGGRSPARICRAPFTAPPIAERLVALRITVTRGSATDGRDVIAAHFSGPRVVHDVRCALSSRAV
jgi:hypothetical protein